MKQRITAWRYFLSAMALTCACSLVGWAQQTAGSQAPKPAAPVKEWPKDRIGGLVAEWTRAKNWTKEYLDKMPEDGLSFKPTPEIRSFAEQMLHLAGGNFSYGQLGTGLKTPYKREDLTPDKIKTKADLSRVVLESYDFVMNGIKALDAAKLDEALSVRGMSIPRSEALMMGFEHQTHHRGQTTIYLRLKGVVPPPEPF